MSDLEIEPGEQVGLLDITTRELDVNWVDPNQPLLIPTNPDHYIAYRYQKILDRLEKQAKNNPAQFNSGNYIALMEKLEKLWEKINGGANVQIHDSGAVETDGLDSPEAGMGEAAPAGVAAGISPDNPFSG